VYDLTVRPFIIGVRVCTQFGGPRWRAALCHGTMGTMVNPALPIVRCTVKCGPTFTSTEHCNNDDGGSDKNNKYEGTMDQQL